jgi:hypothetical protein
MALHDAEPDAAGPLGASAWEIEREVARTLASYGSALRRVRRQPSGRRPAP